MSATVESRFSQCARLYVKDSPCLYCAFTLIELLTVMAVISILAGMVLGTAGYVQKKSARDRARSEIAAMEAALESYKVDNGEYPANPRRPSSASSPPAFGGADILYQALTGDGADTLEGGGAASRGTRNYGENGKAYWEPKDYQLNPAKNQIYDPFGRPYNYVSPGYFNTATFDLWSGSARNATDLEMWENKKVDAKNW